VGSQLGQKKISSFGAVSPVQEIAPPDFLLLATAHGVNTHVARCRKHLLLCVFCHEFFKEDINLWQVRREMKSIVK